MKDEKRDLTIPCEGTYLLECGEAIYTSEEIKIRNLRQQEKTVTINMQDNTDNVKDVLP